MKVFAATEFLGELIIALSVVCCLGLLPCFELAFEVGPEGEGPEMLGLRRDVDGRAFTGTVIVCYALVPLEDEAAAG